MARLLRTGRAFREGLVGGRVQCSELDSVKDLSYPSREVTEAVASTNLKLREA